MTTINLYQNQQKEQKGFFSALAKNGLFFSLSILVVIILVLFGLKFAASLLSKQSGSLAANVQKEKESMLGLGNLEQIVDLQTRLKQIKDNLQIKNSQVSRIQMTQVLSYFGAEVNAGITVSSYEYKSDKNKIDLTFNANNFSDAAQQILNFKESNYFTNVNLIGISRGEKSITCDIEMNVKS